MICLLLHSASPFEARVFLAGLGAAVGQGLSVMAARADYNLHRLGWDLTFHDDFDGTTVDPLAAGNRLHGDDRLRAQQHPHERASRQPAPRLHLPVGVRLHLGRGLLGA